MKEDNRIYDIAGIGIGPFNLGLAALCAPLSELQTIFLDAKPEFNWHEGMLLPGSTLQVSYLADLVTLADPCSPYTYLNFLRQHGRLLQFGIHESNVITRREYNRYCRWVCSRLSNLRFNWKVTMVCYEAARQCYTITGSNPQTGAIQKVVARHVVIGVGTQPSVPGFAMPLLGDRILHSSQYLSHRAMIQHSKQVTVVGSGQSAAEIFYDLLQTGREGDQQLAWMTRSARFYAMEHTKLSFEMATPAYIDHFYRLPEHQKTAILQRQDSLYRGINYELINAVYDHLYDRMTEGNVMPATLMTNVALREIRPAGGNWLLRFYQEEQDAWFEQHSRHVILATGYKTTQPSFLEPLHNRICYDTAGNFKITRRYAIDPDHTLFVQNAEMHTHGFTAPELGLGPYRNAVIINTILGRDHYPVDGPTVFQQFSAPQRPNSDGAA
ncbi:lysine N(6)-hydroxylase/L-ornithine N(5)-oxygenase family protein [Niabella beijingensis]|uniref:lysine N(6)-hydroxylase/L-ornithine N(5)-oxygenase family protein n=1 Tax=Niabella beijingensis TaxID=2872700 RepID=UPI001CBB22BD|nr:SidA/IucD/PvdA family monooxygenase [Niabella beijingensis]MBZ4190455.1 SidA/IucD/PvdA family monooxygenase [Niabella beijingensis]